ncbi:B1135C02.12 [Oryza sativa (japonica cultivar-group)]
MIESVIPVIEISKLTVCLGELQSPHVKLHRNRLREKIDADRHSNESNQDVLTHLLLFEK